MIYMINCSYKGRTSNSRYFLGLLEKEIKKYSDTECVVKNIKNIIVRGFDDFVEDIKGAEALVIGAPLYVDGLPAQVVKLLEMIMERCADEFPAIPVYVVSNLGFYEPQQIRPLFDIVKNWCDKIGTVYGGGIAVGAGPMVRIIQEKSLPAVLYRKVDQDFSKLAKAVEQGQAVENIYCSSAVPRGVYLKYAHKMFNKALRENK
ncbi:MAG: hypothetical protein IKV96_01240 [Firmicutes bacterium]|nr:hypothetical protein [Bacillota bacterium]